MDWTGGARRRFASGKNNATLQKQKAHFAKVRGTLQNSSRSQRTFQPDYLPARYNYKRAAVGITPRQSPHARTKLHKQVASKRPSSDIHRTEAPSGDLAGKTPCTSGTTLYSGSIHQGDSVLHLTRHEPVPPRLTADEQLRANRRRLLARTDWLGLSKTRSAPAIRFPSASEKVQVGRRRKIWNHYSKPAGPRLHTPLFEKRIPHADNFMSGALPAHDFDIRIGTDALATQTAPSRRSQPSRHTSMRQPSTDYGPLSEESMLLGDDGESCEVDRWPVEAAMGKSATMEVPVMTAQYDTTPVDVSEAHYQSHHSPMISKDKDALDDALSPNGLMYHAISDYPGKPSRIARHLLGTDMDVDEQLGQLEDSRQHSAQDYKPNTSAQDFHDMCSAHAEPMKESTGLAVGRMHDEDVWRTTVGIPQESSSHGSMAALRSSSMHQTNSNSDHRAAAIIENARLEQHLPLPSTPRGRGTQATAYSNAWTESKDYSSPDISPQASLKINDRLAKLPAQPTESKAWEADDTNALWRDFCGVDDYASGSSDQFCDMEEADDPDEVGSGTDTFAAAGSVSGLDTSVQAAASKHESGSLFENGDRAQEGPGYDDTGDISDFAASCRRAKQPVSDGRWSNVHVGPQFTGRRQTDTRLVTGDMKPSTRRLNITSQRSRLRRRKSIYDLPTDSTGLS